MRLLDLRQGKTNKSEVIGLHRNLGDQRPSFSMDAVTTCGVNNTTIIRFNTLLIYKMDANVPKLSPFILSVHSRQSSVHMLSFSIQLQMNCMEGAQPITDWEARLNRKWSQGLFRKVFHWGRWGGGGIVKGFFFSPYIVVESSADFRLPSHGILDWWSWQHRHWTLKTKCCPGSQENLATPI